jgi:regulator of replication initiation timing
MACVIALTGLATTIPASAQPMPYGAVIMIPGADGVLRLDEPRRGYRGYTAQGGYAIHDDVISQRYLDSLPRRKAKRPIVHAPRTRTADAAPPAQPVAPAAHPPAPTSAESIKPKDDTDALREQIARLGSETRTLRAEVAALKAELARRVVPSEQRSELPKTAAIAGNDDLAKVREEATRLREETTRLRGDSDKLRDQVTKLTTDTDSLRGEIASLKEELAKRSATASPMVTGKADQQVRPDEPLRRGDSLKKSKDKADNKVVERAPGSEEREVDRIASTMEKVWRRLLEMVGKPKD